MQGWPLFILKLLSTKASLFFCLPTCILLNTVSSLSVCFNDIDSDHASHDRFSILVGASVHRRCRRLLDRLAVLLGNDGDADDDVRWHRSTRQC